MARRQAVSHLAIRADVVPEKCIPSFNQVDVEMKPRITIAFSSRIHLGSGSIELRSKNHHPEASVVVDVKDVDHVAIDSDEMSLSVFGVSLMGSEVYQVLFPAGVVLSASGSKCGTTSEFTFTTKIGECVRGW